MLWLSLSFVTGVFVWLPSGRGAGGQETHRGSGRLPRANIYITRSPAFVAQGRGWLFPRDGVGAGGFDGTRPCKKPILCDETSGPLLFLSCLLGESVTLSISDHLPHGDKAELFSGRADSSLMSPDAPGGHSGPLTEMLFGSARGQSMFRCDSFAPCDQEMVPINLG